MEHTSTASGIAFQNSRVTYIQPTKTTPEVRVSNKIWEISGRSSPEDAYLFYQPLMNLVDQESEDSILEVNFNLVYFNTSSHRYLYQLLRKMDKKVKKLRVIWRHKEFDEDMIEVGEDFSDLLEIPFIFKKNP